MALGRGMVCIARMYLYIRTTKSHCVRACVRAYKYTRLVGERDAARDRAEKRIARMQLHAAAERELTNGS